MATVSIMRAGRRRAIGQLAGAGDDCVEPGPLPADGCRRGRVVARGPAGVRVSRPSLARMYDTCVLTVGTEMNKADAIALALASRCPVRAWQDARPP